MATENRERADIYITQSFNDSELYVDAIKKQNIFREVRFLSYKTFVKYFNRSGRFAAKAQAVRNYLSPRQVVESFIAKDTFYNKIYAANRDIIGRYVQFYHFQNKVNAEFIRFEEGNSTYIGDQLREKKPEKLLRRLLYGKKAVIPNTMYVYSPELFCRMRNDDGRFIKKIVISDNALETIKKVFNHSKMIPVNSAILIDTNKIIFSSDEKERILKIFDTIKQNLDLELFYKPHPRDNRIDFDLNKTLSYQIPFEVTCLDSNMNSAVLISYLSTCVSSPKIIFDKEPFVLLLYKLVNSSLDTKPLDRFYDALRKTYVHADRILIPNDIHELMLSIDKINYSYGRPESVKLKQLKVSNVR